MIYLWEDKMFLFPVWGKMYAEIISEEALASPERENMLRTAWLWQQCVEHAYSAVNVQDDFTVGSPEREGHLSFPLDWLWA